MNNIDHQVSTVDQLNEIIGEAPEFLRAKVVVELDDSMKEFIRRSPLVFISTIDEAGMPDVSPKGDAAGFVQIDSSGNLLIPERPGNKLTFGFRNILRDANIGLIFVVPNMRETLRVKGLASLSKDPAQLQSLSAQNKPAILCTHVEVKECFFHCGKAMIRSKMWQPDAWAEPDNALMARQVTKAIADGDSAAQTLIEDEIERSYREELY